MNKILNEQEEHNFKLTTENDPDSSAFVFFLINIFMS